MAEKWYNDSTIVSTFGQVLVDAGVLTDTDDFKQYLKKPFKYNNEYDAWEENEFPEADDEKWEEFVNDISDEEESEEEGEEEG